VLCPAPAQQQRAERCWANISAIASALLCAHVTRSRRADNKSRGTRFLLAKRCLSTQVVSFRACYGANINQREEDEQTQNEEHRASSRLEQQQVGAEKASCAFWHNLLRENHYHRRRAEAAKKSTKAEAAVTEAGQTKHKAASCVCFGTLFCEVLTCLPCILFTY